jgi:hypothetical protein
MKTMICFRMLILLQAFEQLSGGDHTPLSVDFGGSRRGKIIQQLFRGLRIFRMSADKADQFRR